MSVDGAQRIVAIDGARGAAMLFSCLAHFAWWIELAYPLTCGVLSSIGMIATPTFLVLSGAMTGILLSRDRADIARVKFKLLNRGLFLLTFGHLLVALTEWHRHGSLVRAIAGASVVDEIGLAMTLAGVFAHTLSQPSARRAAGVGAVIALFVCWAVIQYAPAQREWSVLATRALLGARVTDMYGPTYLAPTLQYIAIFALGLSLSDVLMEHRSAAARFTQYGLLLVLTAITARLLRYALDHGLTAGAPLGVDQAFALSGKIPPTPAYLAFYGGLGLAMIGGFIAAWRRGWPYAHAVLQWLAVIGRASLFAFVLQYFLYWTLPDWMGIRPGPWSGLIYVANVLLLWFACRAWTALGGNRLLTVGLRPRIALASS